MLISASPVVTMSLLINKTHNYNLTGQRQDDQTFYFCLLTFYFIITLSNYHIITFTLSH